VTPPPRWLLAVHEDTNANATLFRDGRVVFALAEERLTRDRFAGGFPAQAVQAALAFAGIELADVDAVLPANRHHFLPRLAPQLITGEEHDFFGPKHKAWLYFQHLMARNPAVAWATAALSNSLLQRKKLPRLLDTVDHHTAHAASAWLTSGWDQCLCVTADNMGDGWSSKVFTAGPQGLQFQYGSTARHSPGQFYGEIAQLLGFHNLLAGKVTGLAAHGDPAVAYALVASLFGLDDAGRAFTSPGLWWRHKHLGAYRALAHHQPANVAAAAQRRLEDVMVRYVQTAVRETGQRRVALAGGVFANVVVNQRILALPEVEAVWVHPAMTDQGISMGAGLLHLRDAHGVAGMPMDHVFLGPEPAESAMGAALEAAQLRFERPAELSERAAQALAAGKVVARFAGRLEYGPRALGNRSILAPAHDPRINQWLNARLRRSEFMPFAPVTLWQHRHEGYLGLQGGEDAARFMTMTFGVTDALRAQSAGVVHLDGTARPQLLREQDNPGYYAILRRYAELTGTPTLVNTSFNLHSEPIVCTPEDGIAAFRTGGLDALILGPFWVAPRQ